VALNKRKVTDELESSVRPRRGIFGVQYSDFIDDPLATIVNISKYFGSDDSVIEASSAAYLKQHGF
jgi:hypothetical protein